MIPLRDDLKEQDLKEQNTWIVPDFCHLLLASDINYCLM